MNTFGITLCLALLAAVASSEVPDAPDCAKDCAHTCAIVDVLCPVAEQCAQIKGVCLQLCGAMCACEETCEGAAIAKRAKCDTYFAALPKIPGPLAKLPTLPICQAEEVAAMGVCSGECGVQIATGAAKGALDHAVKGLMPTLMSAMKMLPEPVQKALAPVLAMVMPKPEAQAHA